MRAPLAGWLELDIMLGNWAAANLAALSEAELKQYQAVIAMENPDLFRWLTGQADPPPEVRGRRRPPPRDACPSPVRDPRSPRPQVDNDLLRKLCADLSAAREPKVTVHSASGFEGKVWE